MVLQYTVVFWSVCALMCFNSIPIVTHIGALHCDIIIDEAVR